MGMANVIECFSVANGMLEWSPWLVRGTESMYGKSEGTESIYGKSESWKVCC